MMTTDTSTSTTVRKRTAILAAISSLLLPTRPIPLPIVASFFSALYLTSAQAQEESASTCVIDETGRWATSPPVSLLILEESKLPNVYTRAAEFSAATGARIDITPVSIAEWQSEVFADAGQGGPRAFDGYAVKGNWVPGLVEAESEAASGEEGELEGGLADLSEFVQAGNLWTDLDWVDIVPVVRDSICVYDGKVYTIPIDADYVVSAARDDLLSRDNNLDTWEEWVSFAEAHHNTDLNGDGISSDYGACFAKGEGNNHFSVFAALWAVASPHLQFGGRQAGAFFDTDTLEPLLTNPELQFAEALKLYRRLVAAAPPGTVSALDAKNLFQAGRCATWLSLPGFVFGVQDTGGIKAPNRTNASMARFSAPGVVCNEDMEVGCSYAEKNGGRLINRSPFFATSGISLAISSGATATSRQLLFELFTYISAKAQSNNDVTLRTSFSDPFRNSQLGEDAVNRLVGINGWDAATAEDYLTVTSDILNADGAALDLRVPGLGLYMTSVLEAVAPFVYHGKGTAEEAAKIAAEVWRRIPEQVFVGSSAEAARNAMLGIYRAQLGLPPIVDQDDGFNVQALIVAVSVLGGIFILGLLAFFVYWVNKTYKRKKKLEEEAKALIARQVAEALDIVKQFQAPLVLVRGDHFLELRKICDHESLRDRGILTFIDTMDGFTALFNKKHVTIFFSHQWCAYGEPDPHAIQYPVMCSALMEIAAKEKRPAKDVYVWVDYFSIPQTNRPIQRLAINSLPALASILQYFVAVCPPATHAETGDQCNRDSYFSRCWIRAEVMSYWSRRGTENMYYAERRGDEDSGSVLQALAPAGETRESMGAVRVFQGNLTCCRRSHNGGTEPCDRQELMLPMLGLYAEIYANRSLPSVKPIYEAIEGHLDIIYPSTFEYETGKGKETRVLFGDLISALRQRFDADEGRRASQRILPKLVFGDELVSDRSLRPGIVTEEEQCPSCQEP